MIKCYFFLLCLWLLNFVSVAQVMKDSTNSKSSVPQLIDSLSQTSKHDTDSLQHLTNKIAHLDDSLKPDLSRYQLKIDSLTGHLGSKIDSLNKLGLPTGELLALEDSLRHLAPFKTLQEANEKLATAQQKISQATGKLTKPAAGIGSGINDKLELMRKNSFDGAGLPENVSLPGVTTPTVQVAPGNLDMPGLNGQVGNILENPDIKASTGQLPDISAEVGGLDKAQKGFDEIGQVTDEISGYGQDIKNLRTGNLGELDQMPEKLEEKAVELGGLDTFGQQVGEAEQYKEMLGQGADKEALKQQAMQQVPKLAKNHFAGQEASLQEAINKVTNLKKKYVELTDLENLPKRKPNEMKGKPAVERWLPGITFQIQKPGDVWLDYSIGAGYRISGKFTTGIGWNERIGITNRIGLTFRERIYGPRTFIDFKLKKGFSVRTEAETIHMFVAPGIRSSKPNDVGHYEWVSGFFVGIKKQYDFVKSVKGNFQLLYTINNQQDESPYVNRVNIRFGFEFPIKRRAEQ